MARENTLKKLRGQKAPNNLRKAFTKVSINNKQNNIIGKNLGKLIKNVP